MPVILLTCATLIPASCYGKFEIPIVELTCGTPISIKTCGPKVIRRGQPERARAFAEPAERLIHGILCRCDLAQGLGSCCGQVRGEDRFPRPEGLVTRPEAVAPT
jgi:hypothetical protein